MGRLRTWTVEQLTAAVAASRSIRGVIDRLGLRPCGGTYRYVKMYAAKYGLDTSHWLGQAHLRGSHTTTRQPEALATILRRDRFFSAGKLKQRLIREGVLAERCAWCRRKTWRGKRISLELDHVDGNHINNELTNLRLLCPNCHAQTPTYRGRNARYPNIPSLADIEAGIQRCGSVLAYALELGVTPDRVRGWLRSDRIRARDTQANSLLRDNRNPEVVPEAGLEPARP